MSASFSFALLPPGAHLAYTAWLMSLAYNTVWAELQFLSVFSFFGIRVDLRKRLVKTLVWPVVLYGCETCTMRKVEINRLNAFEMWVWRRMGKVS